MMHPNITLIGAGNMGASFLGGLIKNNYSPEHIWISDTNIHKLTALQEQFGVHVTENNLDAINTADIIILAVKPPFVKQVASEIAQNVQLRKPLVLSIAAGIPISSLERWLGETAPIVRAMPNTPALLGCGASGLFANSQVSHEQHKLAESILRAVGIAVWLDNEKQMDAVTALSGSGPAYFFLISEALENAAVQLGLSREIARLLTLQTAYGAARMALESNTDTATLRQHVTSPGGTTEQAIHVLEESNIRTILLSTLQAAVKRAEELGKNTEK